MSTFLVASPFLALSAEDLRRAGIYLICLILAISVHEFAHAFAANRLGDPTPESEGRLTLNPVSHAHPIGTLVLPIVLALSGSPFFFGWGRPVNTQPRYYTRKITMRAGMALVSFAGPLSNLLLSVMTLGLVWGLGAAGALTVSSPLYQPLYLFFVLNIILFLFNLIPVHPLDGGKVLSWLMGPKYGHVDEFLERNGVWILVALIFILPALNPNLDVLGAVFLPILEFGGALFRAVLG